MLAPADAQMLDPRPETVVAPREDRGDESKDIGTRNRAKILLQQAEEAAPCRHAFSLELANRYGVTESLLLGNLIHRISAKRRRGHAAECAISIRRLAGDYPYLGQPAVARALKKLKNKGVLIAKEKCRNRNNHTLTYSISDQEIIELSKGKRIGFSPVLAAEVGIAEAVLYANHEYWVQKNKRGRHDWIRKSANHLATLLPFSPATLKRALIYLCEVSLLERRSAKDWSQSFEYRIPSDEPPPDSSFCSIGDVDGSTHRWEGSEGTVDRSNDAVDRSDRPIYIPLKESVERTGSKIPEGRTTHEDRTASAPPGDRCANSLSKPEFVDDGNQQNLWDARRLTSMGQLIRILFKSGISDAIKREGGIAYRMRKEPGFEDLSANWVNSINPGTIFELIGECNAAKVINWAQASARQLVSNNQTFFEANETQKAEVAVTGMILNTVITYFDPALTRERSSEYLDFNGFSNRMKEYRKANLESLQNRGLGMIEGHEDFIWRLMMDECKDSSNPDLSPEEKVYKVACQLTAANANGTGPGLMPHEEFGRVSHCFYQFGRHSQKLLKRFFHHNPHWSASDITGIMEAATVDPIVEKDYIKHFHLTKVNDLEFLLRHLDKVLDQCWDFMGDGADLPSDVDFGYLENVRR